MKRCPQCEFIYEDEQSLCDMDGALLVFDSRSLPNLHALAPVNVPVAPKAYWRHRTFPAMAALILASVLSLVYFVSTQQTQHVIAPVPGTGVSLPPLVTNPAPPLATAPEVNTAAVETKDKDDAKPERDRTATAPPRAAKKAAVKQETTQPKPDEPKKEDSKVGSILKKTGRLLKKPFKL
jgi:hypothetical protein